MKGGGDLGSHMFTQRHVTSMGWVGRGHIQSTPSPWVYIDPTSIPPSLRPHSGGSLVVEQPLPLGDRAELEGPHCGFVFVNCTLCVVFHG